MVDKKQPVSVLVVIYTIKLAVLLLERADHPDCWQSVTGSREGVEALRDTAIREVAEETGLIASNYLLTDWQWQNVYEIYPHWRHRYAAGVTQNTEHVFGLQLPDHQPIQLAPREHLSFQWLPYQTAEKKVFSPSNQAAISELMQRVIRTNP
ncbi:MAG: dihydroneopterin triphosphate diphosphatase [Gallionella sp.]